jgi:hypothetical protein
MLSRIEASLSVVCDVERKSIAGIKYSSISIQSYCVRRFCSGNCLTKYSACTVNENSSAAFLTVQVDLLLQVERHIKGYHR